MGGLHVALFIHVQCNIFCRMKNAALGPLPLVKLVYNSQESCHIWSLKNKKDWSLAWKKLKYCLNWRIKKNGLWKTALASFAKHSIKLLGSIDLILHISYFGFVSSIQVLLIFFTRHKMFKVYRQLLVNLSL